MEEKIKKIVQMALEEVNEDADEVIEYGENTALREWILFPLLH